jgi:hypothetical protein
MVFIPFSISYNDLLAQALNKKGRLKAKSVRRTSHF